MKTSSAMRVLSGAFNALALTAMFFLAPGASWYADNRDRVPSQWDPLDPLDLKAPSTFIQRWKIARARGDGALCRAAIARAGLSATPRDDVIKSAHCQLVDTVALRGFGDLTLSKIDTRCGIAMSLYLWEREVVQPAAKRFFGKPVKTLLHFGSYSCRRIAGTARWSQHALGNAVDIAGFRLSGGKTVSVLNDWPKETDEARFLRVVRAGACDHFSMVLGPDFNEAHRDHFHFDNGWWPGCR